MQDSNSLKQIFMKKFLQGLQSTGLSDQNLGVFEKKNIIKLTSDVALASARDGSNWSHAIISKAFQKENQRKIVKNFLGQNLEKKLVKSCQESRTVKKVSRKRIIKKSYSLRMIRKKSPWRTPASSLLKKMMNKKIQMLRFLVPGTETMDELPLLEESVDYILSLRVQVDAMRNLVNTFQISNDKQGL